MATMPPVGPLVDWLRGEAGLPFEEPIGDVGDHLPLMWLTRMVRDQPQDASRLGFAIEVLLGEGDLEISRRILDVLSGAPPAYRSAVARAVGKHSQVLASVDVPDANQTLLGAAVRPLAQDRLAEALSDETLQVLARIDRSEDGWPTSLAIGLWADYARFADALVAAVARLDGPPLDRFLLDVMSWVGEPTTTEGFERIGRETSDELRRRFGAAVKRQIDELAESRKMMLQMGVQLPPQDPPDVRWAAAAARLQIQP
jgi:hypothetical protein